MACAYSKWLVLVPTLLCLALVVGLWRKRRAWQQLGDASAGVWHNGRWLTLVKMGMLFGAALLLGITLVGPQWGRTEVPAPPVAGRDIFIVLDVSRSMLAEDVEPNRLGRAKSDILDLASTLERRGGQRIGLVVFADRAVQVCPLTRDFRAFSEELTRISLDGLRVRGSANAYDGTQLAAALQRVNQSIRDEFASCTDVLIFSDGGDMAHDTLDLADQLGQRGVTIHTVGLGNPTQASPIPISGQGPLTYQGEVVRTRLEEEVLRTIAAKAGGKYHAVTTGFLSADQMLDTLFTQRPKQDRQDTEKHWIGIPRFQWFLAPAVTLLLLELLLGPWRARTNTERSPRYFGWVRRRTTVQGGTHS